MKKANIDYVFVRLGTEGSVRYNSQRVVYGLITLHDFSLIRGIVRRGYEEIALLRTEEKFELVKGRLTDLNTRVADRLKQNIVEIAYLSKNARDTSDPIKTLGWRGEEVEIVEHIRLTSNMLVSTESFGYTQ